LLDSIAKRARQERNMQRKLVGAVGVMSAFAALDSAQAAAPSAPDVAEFLKPQSFAELLAPVHNAAALLKAVDEAQSAERKANPQVAQYYYHHHHHHHHSYWRSGPPSYDDGRGFTSLSMATITAAVAAHTTGACRSSGAHSTLVAADFVAASTSLEPSAARGMRGRS
jgi:hypothetical protein